MSTKATGFNRQSKKVKVSALEEMEVDYISLVEKGANRIPFRIMKSEDAMSIDLSKLWFKKQDTAPAIAAVIVNKAQVSKEFVDSLEATGFEIAKQEVIDDRTVFFAKEDGDLTEDGMTVIKANGDIAVAVQGVAKAFHPYDEMGSFSDMVKAQGFYPSMSVAMDAMQLSVLKALHEEGESDGSAIEKIDAVMNEFHGYMVDLVRSLPATVFKVEKLDANIGEGTEEATQETEEEETTQKEEATEATDTEATDDKATAASEEATDDVAKEDKDATVETDDDTKDSAVAKEDSSEESETQKKDPAEEILKSVKDMLTETLKPVSESIDALKADIEGVKNSAEATAKKVEDVESIAKASQEALHGTVPSNGGNPDDGNKSVTKSSGKQGIWDDVLPIGK